MRIEVVQADITTLAVTAIVNAANSSLTGGGTDLLFIVCGELGRQMPKGGESLTNAKFLGFVSTVLADAVIRKYVRSRLNH